MFYHKQLPFIKNYKHWRKILFNKVHLKNVEDLNMNIVQILVHNVINHKLLLMMMTIKKLMKQNNRN